MSDINKLERIKQAYYSGLKVQIWFNGYWENFDARDYSMYSDPFSENRQYRIVGSAYADIAEKRIAVLEKENADLKALRKYELNVSKLEIEKLEKENKWLKLGYNIKNCKGKTCINCDNYNEIGWFDENNIPQVSCRLGGYHYGLDACEDFKQVDK